MASTQEQASWLTESAGVFVTSDRVVRVLGEDGVSWLNGQVTADVRNLAEGVATYTLSVSLKGRVQTDLWAIRGPDGLSVVLPARCQEQALAAFDKHIIMEDVELVPDATLRVLSVQGPKADAVCEALSEASVVRYACARLFPGAGVDLWLPEAALESALSTLSCAAHELGGGRVDEAGWAHAHVLLGIARAGIDFGLETYPQEAGLKTRAVSFSKGCYTGQEVVYMLEKRGQLARRLVQLVGPPELLSAGELVLDAEGKRIGEVTSATQTATSGTALAYLKRGHAEVSTQVQVRNRAWEVRRVLGASDSSCPIVAST